MKKLKKKATDALQEIHNEYAGKAIDFEESGKEEKMYEMFDITDQLEEMIDYINNL